MEEKEIPLFGSLKTLKGKKGKGSKGKKGSSYFDGIKKVLTDDQKVTFKAIKVAYKEKFKTIQGQVKDGTLSKEDAKAQKDALKEAMKAESDALLTDEQKAQLEQNKADRKEKRKAYRDATKAVKIAVLGMTTDQLTAFDAAHQEAREAAKALFEKSKNGDIDKDTLREGLKNIFAEKNEKMEGIFNDNQLEIIKIHKALSLRKKKHKGKKGKGGSKSNKG